MTTTNTTTTYTALEDNAGGLYLVVRDAAGHTIYLGTGYQYSSDDHTLSQDIAALERGESPDSWDDNLLTDEEFLEQMRRTDTEDGTGYYPGVATDTDGNTIPMTEDEVTELLDDLEVIADNGVLYPDRMGNAARREFFEVEDED